MSESGEKKKGFSTAYSGKSEFHNTDRMVSDHAEKRGSISLSNHSGGRDRPKPESRRDEYIPTRDRESNDDGIEHFSKMQLLEDISERIGEPRNYTSGKSSNDANSKKLTLCIITIAASAVMTISCFLPIVTVSMFGYKQSSSIMQSISEELLPEATLILPLLCILSLVFSVVSIKNYRALYGTAITSVIGAAMLVIVMNTPDDFLRIRLADYAGIGYYLFMLASFTAIVLSVVVLTQASGWVKRDHVSEPEAPFTRSLVEEESECQRCGASVPKGTTLCWKCSNKTVPAYDSMEWNRRETIVPTPCESFIASPKEAQAQNTINYVALGLTIVCTFLWIVAPFMAVNLWTWGDQPTALELLQGDVWYFGDLSTSLAFLAALTSIIGTAICFVCVLAKSKNATRIAAACTLLPLVGSFFYVARWVDDVDEFMGFFGIGYWGIAVCLLMLVFWGGQAKKNS